MSRTKEKLRLHGEVAGLLGRCAGTAPEIKGRGWVVSGDGGIRVVVRALNRRVRERAIERLLLRQKRAFLRRAARAASGGNRRAGGEPGPSLQRGLTAATLFVPRAMDDEGGDDAGKSGGFGPQFSADDARKWLGVSVSEGGGAAAPEGGEDAELHALTKQRIPTYLFYTSFGGLAGMRTAVRESVARHRAEMKRRMWTRLQLPG